MHSKEQGFPDFAIAPARSISRADWRATVSGSRWASGTPTPLLRGVALWGADGFLTAVADVAGDTLTMAAGPGAPWRRLPRRVRRSGSPHCTGAGDGSLASLPETGVILPALRHCAASRCSACDDRCRGRKRPRSRTGRSETSAPAQVAEMRRRTIVEGSHLSPQQFQQLSPRQARARPPRPSPSSPVRHSQPTSSSACKEKERECHVSHRSPPRSSQLVAAAPSWLQGGARPRRPARRRGGGTLDRYGDVLYLANFYTHFPLFRISEGNWSARAHTFLVLPTDAAPGCWIDVP